MRNRSFLSIVIAIMLFANCDSNSNNKDMFTDNPKKMLLISMKTDLDTIIIYDENIIKEIKKIINQGSPSSAKMNLDYMLTYTKGDSIIRIGVNKNRFFYSEGYFVVNKNFSAYLEKVKTNKDIR